MKRLKVFLVYLIMLSFGFQIVNSVDSCCYVSSSPEINPIQGIDCGSGINLGPVDSDHSCQSYNLKKLGCIDLNNVCSDNVNGRYLFDFPSLFNLPNPSKIFLTSNFCKGGLVDFSSNSICSPSSNNDVGLNPNPTTTGDTTSSGQNSIGSGSQTIIPPPTETQTNQISNIDKNLGCYKTGGSLGFFINKVDCELTKDLNGENCVYNPYLGGFLSSHSGFINLKVLNQGILEDSCISKNLIRSIGCFAYKNEDNCNNDKANLYDNCKWIPSSNYLGSYINKKSGICISNKVSNNKFYNKKFYSDSRNLIKNPSFEYEGDWKGLKIEQGINSQNSFDGHWSYNLDNTGISQEISNLEEEKSYIPFLYIKYNSSLLNSGISLKITAYDSNSQIIGNPQISPNFLLKNLKNPINNIFEFVKFSSYIILKGTKKIKIEIKSIDSNKIDIDGVNFIKENTLTKINSQTIFSPVSIINSKASNCNLCHENLNFNTCTKKKSELLGDCSYLVSNVGNKYENKVKFYTGDFSNIYMYKKDKINENLSWNSQSLPNAKLFCNLYVNKFQCENPNNYVNLKFKNLNPESGSTLCKWSSNFGCFKDSNNDGFSDIITILGNHPFNYPFITRYSENLLGKVNTKNIKPYDDLNYINKFDKISFNKSCDSLPPNFYMYLTGKNVNGEKIILNKNYNGIVGGLKFHFKANDLNLESCKKFYNKKKIILDIGINSKYFTKEFDISQIDKEFSFKQLFLNVNEYSESDGTHHTIDMTNLKSIFLSKTGENKFSFRILDQSGNVGKTFNFNFGNMDLKGPEIKLTNFNYISKTNWLDFSQILLKNSIFKFSVKDLTNFQCNLSLNPLETVDPSFYFSNGKFNKTVNMTGDIFNFKLKDYILNTSPNGDSYNLTINCSDSFGQLSTKETLFSVDFNTQLLVISPKRYIENTDSMSGYLNSKTPFNAISSEISLSNCQFKDFGNDLVDSNLQIINSVNGFQLDSNPDITFYNNVTGNLEFNSQGLKKGNVSCTDLVGNEILKNLTYYYDSINPELLNFELVNIKSPLGANSTYFDGTNYYTYLSGNNIKLNLSFSGTGTYVNSIQNFSEWNETRILENRNNIPFDILSKDNIVNTDKSNFLISGFDDKLLYTGIPQIEKGLYLKKFSFNYSDKVKNNNSGNIQYFFDDSTPKFNFSGDIVSQDDTLNEIYTSSNDPLIKINFSTPEYRKYSCKVNIYGDSFPNGYDLIPKITSKTKFSFKISQVLQNRNFNLITENIGIKLNCKDIYNLTLTGDYKFIYDNVNPILNSISLKTGNTKFFSATSTNVVFSSIIDDLVLDLADTGESNYKCNYDFRVLNDRFYHCNTNLNQVSFTSSGIKSILGLNILDGTNSNPNALCIRNNNFNNELQNAINLNKNLNTKILVSVNCKDKVGLQTQTKVLPINILYSNNDFISLKFSYKNRKAFAIVKSFNKFSSIFISSSSNSIGTPFEVLSNPTTISGGQIPVYQYVATQGIDFSKFHNGNNIVFAVSPNKNSFLQGNLLVDNLNPLGEIKIQDEVKGYIFSKNFTIDLMGKDTNGPLNKIILYLDNKEIFKFNGTNYTYDNNSIFIPKNYDFSFTNSNSNFKDSIKFINATLNTNYTFKLNISDSVNNINLTNKSIFVKDGIEIILKNSKNSKADLSNNFWITKNKAPIINFTTSKPVFRCSIKPVESNDWKGIYSNSVLISKSSPSGLNSFSFDLSSEPELKGLFDMSKIKSSINLINISCIDLKDKSKSYNYKRELKFIDSVPDYVLSSSNGFVLNEAPYTTEINVKSVGAYRYINCKYSDGINGFKDFLQKDDVLFNTKLDYSTSNNGIYGIKIKCIDVLGNIGPTKVYNISISHNSNLQIKDVNIYSSNLNHLSKVFPNNENDGSIYLSDLQNLVLNFKTNKKNNVICSYTKSSGSIMSKIVDFFLNIFSNPSKKVLTNNNPFLYSSNGLDFTDKKSVLNIECSIGNSEDIIKTYNVIQVNDVNKANLI